MRRIRIAAFLSAFVGFACAVPFNLRVPRTLDDWYQVVFGLILVAVSLAVAARLRLARRVLVVLLWVGALLCGLGLVFCGVMLWTTGQWPGLHGWNLLAAAIVVYYSLGAALFGGLYLFFHSERVVQAYGS